jgi:hypothetical protein
VVYKAGELKKKRARPIEFKVVSKFYAAHQTIMNAKAERSIY